MTVDITFSAMMSFTLLTLCTQNAKVGYCCVFVTGIMAISKINEFIEKGKPEETLEALKLPEAKLENVDDKQAYHYQVLLVRRKKEKAEVKL